MENKKSFFYLRFYTDTNSTLNFAEACRQIKNKVTVNEDVTGESVLAFQKEILRLNEQLRKIREGSWGV